MPRASRPTPRRRPPAGRLPFLPRLVLALGLVLLAPPAASEEPAVLARMEGSVEVGVGDPPRFRPARAGESLPVGAVLRTGPDARAEVRRGGETLRLYGDTLLQLQVGPTRTRVELERGRSLFDVLGGDGRRFEVDTREVAVLVKGTRFLVDAEDGFVSVFRGVVGVADLRGDASPVDVRAGLSLTRPDAASPLELHVSPFADPWEAWSREGAPPQLERPAPAGELDRQAAREVRRAMAERPRRIEAPLGPEDVAGARGESVSVERGASLPAKRLDPVLDVRRGMATSARRGGTRPAAGGDGGAGGGSSSGGQVGSSGGGGPAGPGESGGGPPQGPVTTLLDDLLGPDGVLGGLTGGVFGGDDWEGGED